MRISGVPYIQGRNAYADADATKYGIAIHNTSNSASAEDEAAYATRRTDGTSSHLYVDNNSVVQSLDTNSRAGHAGSSNGNQNAVAVEITGTNGKTRQWWLDNVAWDKLGAALAQVVRKYGVAVRRASVAEMRSNPKVKAFYGHDDMRLAWGGTDHTDPGPTFPWDRLFQAVNAALGTPTTTQEDDDMALTDIVPATGNRTVGTVLSDLFNGEQSAASGFDPRYQTQRQAALSRIEGMLKDLAGKPATAPVELTDEQLDKLADKVAAKLGGGTIALSGTYTPADQA